MNRRHETEIKLPVRDLRILKRRLGELGFRVVRPRHFERNTLYDFPDLRLWKAKCLLRLRLAGKEWLLTFKGAPLASRRYKVRGEIETRLEDGNCLNEIFCKLGLQPAFRYEKFRTVYARDAAGKRSETAQLVCDETPIGIYLELEGPRRWIDEVARQLAYSPDDYITASYASLYRQKCLERGETPRDMVFAPKKS